MIYLDSSALVKLVIADPESQALRRYLRSEPADVLGLVVEAPR